MGENDVIINDRPKFQTKDTTEDDHAIIIERDDVTKYHIPLSLRGITSTMDVRKPSELEVADDSLEWFELTYETPKREPGTEQFKELDSRLETEISLRPLTGDSTSISVIGFAKPHRFLNVTKCNAISTYEHEASQQAAVMALISLIYCNDLLVRNMQDKCCVSAVTSSNVAKGISAELLARNWGIPLEQAKRTLKVITQKGIKSGPEVLVRRFET
jgi:hypothetical protein